MLNAVLWYVAISLTGPLVVLTLAPLVLTTGSWVVRAWDFPRLQLAALTSVPAVPLLVIISRDAGAWFATALLVLLLAMAASGVVQLLPFTRLWSREVEGLGEAARNEDSLRILVANVRYESRQFEAVSNAILEADPDLLLLIEIDETWHSALHSLAQGYPHRIESIADEGLGLALWSRRPLGWGGIEHLISERRPSIVAEVETPDGRTIRFVGLHPTPPGLRDSTGQDRRDSNVRDAELVLLARRIATDPNRNWIVAGDFNDVAWSHTTRLFKRLSGMLDPRVGRKLMNTFHAGRWYLRFPVDHLFVAPGTRIGRLDRVRLPGSDHFGLLATIALEPRSEARPADPDSDADDAHEAAHAVERGAEDAGARGVKSGDPTRSI